MVERLLIYLFLLVIIIFCLIANQYLINNQSAIENFGTQSKNTFIWFSLKGCPHCVNVEKSGEFSKLQKKYKSSEKISVLYVECSKAQDPLLCYLKNENSNKIVGSENKAKKIYEKYEAKIQGFPTFLFVKNGEVMTYNSERTYNNFVQFLESKS